MIDLRTLKGPAFVPSYMPVRDVPIPAIGDSMWSDFNGDRSRLTLHSFSVLSMAERIASCLPKSVDGPVSAMFNRYDVDHPLGWHSDATQKQDYRMLLALKGVGTLSFWKGPPNESAIVDVWEKPKPSAMWTFTLHPGDAIFWTRQSELEGWCHGGRTGERMSLIARFNL